jgi:hypothetical protein
MNKSLLWSAVITVVFLAACVAVQAIKIAQLEKTIRSQEIEIKNGALNLEWERTLNQD